jgi:hypothetical protein
LISGNFDISFLLDSINNPQFDGGLKVIMSWQLAKKFSQSLNQEIESYEKIFAPIVCDANQQVLQELYDNGTIREEKLG